jgi:hypothetical protein
VVRQGSFADCLEGGHVAERWTKVCDACGEIAVETAEVLHQGRWLEKDLCKTHVAAVLVGSDVGWSGPDSLLADLADDGDSRPPMRWLGGSRPFPVRPPGPHHP